MAVAVVVFNTFRNAFRLSLADNGVWCLEERKTELRAEQKRIHQKLQQQIW